MPHEQLDFSLFYLYTKPSPRLAYSVVAFCSCSWRCSCCCRIALLLHFISLLLPFLVLLVLLVLRRLHCGPRG